jgi:hypothetical protein
MVTTLWSPTSRSVDTAVSDVRPSLDDSTLGVGQSRGDGIRGGVEEAGLQTLHVLVGDAPRRHKDGLRDTSRCRWTIGTTARVSIAVAGRDAGWWAGKVSQPTAVSRVCRSPPTRWSSS